MGEGRPRPRPGDDLRPEDRRPPGSGRHDGQRARHPRAARRRRRPSTSTACSRRMREAVGDPAAAEDAAASTARTTPTSRSLDLEADLARAERLDPASRERFLRELYVDAHKGQQGNWKPKEACKDVEGRAQGGEGRAGSLHEGLGRPPRLGPARPAAGLPDGLRRHEGERRRRGLPGPPPPRARRPPATRSRCAATSRSASTSSWWTSSRTPTPCRPRSPSSWPRTRKGSRRPRLARLPPEARQALRRRRPQAVASTASAAPTSRSTTRRSASSRRAAERSSPSPPTSAPSPRSSPSSTSASTRSSRSPTSTRRPWPSPPTGTRCDREGARTLALPVPQLPEDGDRKVGTI